MRPLTAPLAALLLLAACGEPEPAAAPPPPQEITGDSIGYYDRMIVPGHHGPKGQIFLAGQDQPHWFTSVRDAVAFTLLPEESKDIRAIYVNDMARAATWDDPGPGTWIDATQAHYVIESARTGGMGQPEAVPFSTPDAADAFAREHGGRVVAWTGIPHDYILGTNPGPSPSHEH